MSLCDPCSFLNKTSVANHVCRTCDEHYCQECKQDHSKFRALRQHQVANLAEDETSEYKGSVNNDALKHANSNDYTSREKAGQSLYIGSDDYTSREKAGQSLDIGSDDYTSCEKAGQSLDIGSDDYSPREKAGQSLDIGSDDYTPREKAGQSLDIGSDDYTPREKAGQSLYIGSDDYASTSVNHQETKKHINDYPNFEFVSFDGDPKNVHDDATFGASNAHDPPRPPTGTSNNTEIETEGKCFNVSIQDSSLARRIGISGTSCLVEINQTGVVIYQGSTKVDTFGFHLMRRYGIEKNQHTFSMELGRRCEFGEGMLFMESSQAKDIKTEIKGVLSLQKAKLK